MGRQTSLRDGPVRPVLSEGVTTESPVERVGIRQYLYVGDNGHMLTCSDVSTLGKHPFTATILVGVCLDPFELGVSGPRTECHGVAVKAGVPHSIRAGERLFCIHVSPPHPHFRRFSALRMPGVMPIDRQLLIPFNGEIARAYRGELTSKEAFELFEGITGAVARYLPAIKAPDVRTERILRMALIEDRRRLQETLKTALGLSRYRLSHLFTQSMGLSLKSYLVWQKTVRTLAQLEAGQSVTDLAFSSGFYDLSHFSRTFQHVYGVRPSDILPGGSVRVVCFNADCR